MFIPKWVLSFIARHKPEPIDLQNEGFIIMEMMGNVCIKQKKEKLPARRS